MRRDEPTRSGVRQCNEPLALDGAGQKTFIRFPPHTQNILVPSGPRAASTRALTLYTACRAKPLTAQRALWALSWVTGARALPGRRESWEPPMGGDQFAQLRAQWSECVDNISSRAEIDGIAVYNRVQGTREGIVLLVCAGRGSMLVRLRSDGESMDLERRISVESQRRPVMTFRVPRLVGEGSTADWHWVGYEAISRAPHTPVLRMSDQLTDDITELVESVVPRPDGIPGHWRGSHGDLTPWNLRRARRTTWLIDWEDAEWAPPGSDAVYFAATTAALRGSVKRAMDPSPRLFEACQFWAERVRGRSIADTEARLQDRLLTLLDARQGA